MTRHYLCGELSARLARLEGVAASQASSRDVHELRHAAEMASPFALSAVAQQALHLADSLCWDALQRGDIAAFADEAAIVADLYEFAICAQLLEET